MKDPKAWEWANRYAPHERTQVALILDLLGEDSWRNVYAAGELELRPPRVPTTEPHEEALDRL